MDSDSDTVGIINAISIDTDNDNEVVGEESRSNSTGTGVSSGEEVLKNSLSRFLEPIVFLLCFAFSLNGK